MLKKELLDIIKNRRAIFPPEYTSEEITQEELSQIFEAANWAPTHKKTEPWRFKVIKNESKNRFKEFIKRIYVQTTAPENLNERKINGMVEKCDKSDTIILISFQDTEKLPEWEELAATSMSVQNMWLMCSVMNIGCYWSSPLNIIGNMDEFTPMEDGEKCVGILYMGKVEPRERLGSRTPIENKVKYLDY